MKFTLKEYQDEAVRDVLINLDKARRRWHEDGDSHAFSLTATTGAGKTVMAAAVFEALFFGNEEFNVDPDPTATVIWFSDDPSLNEQTRFRLMEASDRLPHSDLVTVQNTFNRETFERGKVYFLNTQKLGKKSLLVRGHEWQEEVAELTQPFPEMRPDLRSFTIWDTIQNTVEDPELTLYLVLDEAHRGMGNGTSAAVDAKSTIVKRLINGSGHVPPIPIVWGISATVERFDEAMKGAEGRSTLPNVVVDPVRVHESGLLKDTIVLDTPNEVGQFDTVLVRRATDHLKDLSETWAEYAEQQRISEPVLPLMILQVPNTPNHDDIGRALDTIIERWPELDSDAFAHVFGEHTTQTFGRYSVPYVSPETVQDSRWVRVLIAKDAISTGWDCPRAEVLVSFRPAKDRTAITQLMGRMVRAPLARRIPGNERLNSVDCLLPFFDTKAVVAIADMLMTGSVEDGDAGSGGYRVLIDPKQMEPGASVPEKVWEKFRSLPSQSLPRIEARPVKRLTALAHELAVDGLLKDAGKLALSELHQALDAASVRYAKEIKGARKAVLTVEGRTLKAHLRDQTKSLDDFIEDADFVVIEDAYRRAGRVLGKELCRTYAEHLADKTQSDESKEEALIEAHADIAALGLVASVKTYVDAEADKLATAWFSDYRIPIKNLSDERQDVYRGIKSMSSEPEDIDLAMPSSWMVKSVAREADGTETPLATYEKHLLCDQDGAFPAELNEWEQEVLDRETMRDGFVGWYRNPSRTSQDSLGIAYEIDGRVKLLRPDFVFFFELPNGDIVADIVDPHGTQFSDALPKMLGMCQYAEQHAGDFRRIEVVAKVGEKMRVLDLTDGDVRVAIQSASDAKSLYEGPSASDY